MLKFLCGSKASIEETATDFDEDYELTGRILGRGANGYVQQASCRISGRHMAVKSCDKRKMSARGLARLRRELDVVQGLSHPNIVTLEQVYESKSSAHMVMEELQGGQLLGKLQMSGPCSESEAASIASQLLQATAYLHEQQLVHCDIKPENVCFQQHAGRTVKLVDFGSVLRLENGKVSDPKQLREVTFTPGYAAPEVLRGCTLDAKADMWSIGSVLYTVLTGHFACAGNTEEVYRKNKQGKVDYSFAFRRLPADARELLQSLLDPEPGKRPSAREALEHPWLRGAQQQREHEEAKAEPKKETMAFQQLAKLATEVALVQVCCTPQAACLVEAAVGICRVLSEVDSTKPRKALPVC